MSVYASCALDRKLAAYCTDNRERGVDLAPLLDAMDLLDRVLDLADARTGRS